MIIENIIREPDRILRLAEIASKDKHRNAKNYVNFERRLKNYIAFHIILEESDFGWPTVVGFGGIYRSEEWPKDLVRINDRMWHHPTHRFKGLGKKGGKSRDGVKIGLSSETLVPFQTEFCHIRKWKPFISVEGVSRRRALKRIVDDFIDPQYGYKLLPDMYYTCTNKEIEVSYGPYNAIIEPEMLEKQCWQSVIAIMDDIGLPKMSVKKCEKMLKGT